jgi:hypothetical protein
VLSAPIYWKGKLTIILLFLYSSFQEPLWRKVEVRPLDPDPRKASSPSSCLNILLSCIIHTSDLVNPCAHSMAYRRKIFLTSKEPVYQALFVENESFDHVLISPRMVADHMPDQVLAALEKVHCLLTNYFSRACRSCYFPEVHLNNCYTFFGFGWTACLLTTWVFRLWGSWRFHPRAEMVWDFPRALLKHLPPNCIVATWLWILFCAWLDCFGCYWLYIPVSLTLINRTEMQKGFFVFVLE